jgi:glyoxylase-like metal-dependent hydrolase (beta-lactamase superfamily II)
MNWKISPVLGGEFGMVRDDIKFSGGDPGITGMVPSLLFLLENEGRQIVIDTSFGNPEDVNAMGLVVKREGIFEDRIRKAGIIPDKVEALLLTHTHWDHADNCACFKNAKIYCQQKDYDYAFAGDSGYTPKLQETFRRAEKQLVLLSGDVDIMPGIRAIFIGGHTPGSQMFEVDTENGRVIITGDDIMTFANVEKNIPIGICVNPKGCRRALEYVRQKKAAFLLPSHDYRTLDYLENPASCGYHYL